MGVRGVPELRAGTTWGMSHPPCPRLSTRAPCSKEGFQNWSGDCWGGCGLNNTINSMLYVYNTNKWMGDHGLCIWFSNNIMYTCLHKPYDVYKEIDCMVVFNLPHIFLTGRHHCCIWWWHNKLIIRITFTYKYPSRPWTASLPHPGWSQAHLKVQGGAKPGRTLANPARPRDKSRSKPQDQGPMTYEGCLHVGVNPILYKCAQYKNLMGAHGLWFPNNIMYTCLYNPYAVSKAVHCIVSFNLPHPLHLIYKMPMLLSCTCKLTYPGPSAS